MLSRELKRETERHGVVLGDDDCINQFAVLIQKARDKAGEKVAVIIDEYDKPLLAAIDEPALHAKTREYLKGFYGVLKSYDMYLRFVFLTGVSKFSHVSVFSDLNHLGDLTLDPRYADICGITQAELEAVFRPELEAVLGKAERAARATWKSCAAFAGAAQGRRGRGHRRAAAVLRGDTLRHYQGH